MGNDTPELKPWFVRKPGPRRAHRLYCFAYAGGNAATYLDWQDAMPAHVEICGIQLPGRGARFGEAPFRAMRPLVDILDAQIRQASGVPFAFFGHSLGGLVAFETARALARRDAPQPRRLIVSGCQAPATRDVPRNYHLLDDAALVDVLREYDATPGAVLADPELVALLLPTIRADFALAETYTYAPDRPLGIPVSVFAGIDDDFTSREQIAGWSTETTGDCDAHWFEGGHFYIHSQRERVLRTLSSLLEATFDP